MTRITAIVADDEAPVRKHLLTQLLAVWPDLIISGEAENGPAALALIEKLKPDIAFLDIKMPGFSGMDVAKRVAGICRVVFITAHDEFAVEAFESEAIDYLLKPITEERLSKTAQRLIESITSSRRPPIHLPDIIARIMADMQRNKASDYLQWVKVPYQDGIRLVSVNDIYYFQANLKYSKAFLKNQSPLINLSISSLSKELDPNVFWQIHRGTIVNISYIDKVSTSKTGRGLIKLKDRSELLTVSRPYLHLFK